MNSEKKEFSFGNYGQAIYPPGIDTLNRLYDAVYFYEVKKSSVPEFIKFWGCWETGLWYQIAEFSMGNDGKMLILFPYCQDRHGEIRLDQSIAICSENVLEEKYLPIFQKVVDAFWDEYFSCSYHDPRKKLPEEIFSRTLSDGRKTVPFWYVDVRANLEPLFEGDMFLSHLAARKWFEEQGYVVI